MIKKLVFMLIVVIAPQSYASECVILLHGLARTEKSMLKIEKALLERKYLVINSGYESRKNTVEVLSEAAIPSAIKSCQRANGTHIHFVTHSMGGILVRYYLKNNDVSNLGKVVMLGPPNKGSEIVDELSKLPGFEWLNGPAGMQLGTSSESLPYLLGDVNFNLGVIAGTKSINLILSNFLPNPDDGKVSVESTKVKGMNDHISMPVTHPFMMSNADLILQVIFYLQHGRFNHSKPQ